VASVIHPAPIRPWSLRTITTLRRLVPGEGWTAVLLHAAIVLAAAATVQPADWAPTRSVLVIAALGGLLAGLVFGKLRAPDLLAHLVAFWGGLALIVWLTLDRLAAIPGGRRPRLQFLWDEGLAWYRGGSSSHRLDDGPLFAVTVALTIWLIAYASAWVLYRRGWLTVALVLPGIIAAANLSYAPDASTAPLLVYVVAACLLAARHHAYRRERHWARTRIPRPPRLSWRFVGAGANVALVVAILGWTLPLSARTSLFASTWDRLDESAQSIVNRWDDWFGDWGGSTRNTRGSYAAFGESFRLGGPLHLADDPVVVLRNSGQEPRPTYLAGHRYDRYDGHGWSSDVEETFQDTNAVGTRYRPQMRFAAGQGIQLSTDITDARSTVAGTVTVLRPKANLLFTTDTYLAVDRKASVQLSWRQLQNAPYDVGAAANLRLVPVDLQRVASLLQQASFPVPSGSAQATDSPSPSDPVMAQNLANERAELNARFLQTRWDVGPDGHATTLFVTGQIPVYDDVEAVFSEAPVTEGQVYAVTALASTASPDQLRQASGDYPAYVRSRYLALPDTVTQRTRDRAAQLAASQPTPFDVALAVQDYVRGSIAYQEDIPVPPSGQDVVDYVLFDSHQGYCEYYASAMAVLLRSLDIPARVVGGYFPVPYDASQQGFLYKEKNAHLWVEVFFPGYGWIPFEPTASREPLAYGGLDSPTQPPATPEPEATATSDAPGSPEAAVPAPPPAGSAGTNGRSWFGRSPSPLGWASLVGGLAIVLAILVASLVWLWGFRGLTPVGGFYARVIRAGRWFGVRPNAATTPAEYADRLGRAVPPARGSAQLVADLYSQELYAARKPAPAAAHSGRAAWVDLRRALLRAWLHRPRINRGGNDRA